jgi:serine/threonine protein kinase
MIVGQVTTPERQMCRLMICSSSTALPCRNIGCDIRGDYKIFDFGLAKELKSRDLREAPDGYDFTGLTGSRRWMAPEVVLCKHYGLKADVYAYSVLFFHVMSLEMPYHRYDVKKHMARVAIGGERPDSKKLKSSPALSAIIVRGWNTNPNHRPSMSELCDAIQVEVVDRKQNIKKNKRKSEVHGILRRSMILKEQSDLSLVLEETVEERD